MVFIGCLSPSTLPLRSLLMFYEDWRGVKKLLAKAKLLCDQGGDWERKNKLKVWVWTLYP